jgi:hypothetical protein
MPTYRFLNNDTGVEYVEFLSITEREEYLNNNPNIVQLLNGAPSIGDSVRLGLRKPDNGFRDKLREMKKIHSKGLTRSTINTFD